MSDDIGTAYVRDVGCGVRYIINLEDSEEEQFEVELDREQLERLAAVIQRLLNEGNGNPPVPAPLIPVPPFTPQPNWLKLPFSPPNVSWTWR
jgi:hypothetical protein